MLVTILLLAVVLFVAAYRIYGRFLEKQFGIDPRHARGTSVARACIGKNVVRGFWRWFFVGSLLSHVAGRDNTPYRISPVIRDSDVPEKSASITEPHHSNQLGPIRDWTRDRRVETR